MEFSSVLLEPAREYLKSIPPSERALVLSAVTALQSGEFESVHTKQLKGPVRELIIGPHRLTYFMHKDGFYFVRGFRKKSQKAPKREIEYAEKWYKYITS